MRDAARIWLSLTRCTVWLALASACSNTGLPLETDTDLARTGKLPVEFAGAGGRATVGTGEAGSVGTPGARATRPASRGDNPGAVCGDGRVDAPFELCDRTNLDGATCRSLGYQAGGTLLCNPTTCYFDTTMCRMSPTEVVPPPPPAGMTPAGRTPDMTGADAGTEEDAG